MKFIELHLAHSETPLSIWINFDTVRSVSLEVGKQNPATRIEYTSGMSVLVKEPIPEVFALIKRWD